MFDRVLAFTASRAGRTGLALALGLLSTVPACGDDDGATTDGDTSETDGGDTGGGTGGTTDVATRAFEEAFNLPGSGQTRTYSFAPTAGGSPVSVIVANRVVSTIDPKPVYEFTFRPGGFALGKLFFAVRDDAFTHIGYDDEKVNPAANGKGPHYFSPPAIIAQPPELDTVGVVLNQGDNWDTADVEEKQAGAVVGFKRSFTSTVQAVGSVTVDGTQYDNAYTFELRNEPLETADTEPGRVSTFTFQKDLGLVSIVSRLNGVDFDYTLQKKAE